MLSVYCIVQVYLYFTKSIYIAYFFKNYLKFFSKQTYFAGLNSIFILNSTKSIKKKLAVFIYLEIYSLLLKQLRIFVQNFCVVLTPHTYWCLGETWRDYCSSRSCWRRNSGTPECPSQAPVYAVKEVRGYKEKVFHVFFFFRILLGRFVHVCFPVNMIIQIILTRHFSSKPDLTLTGQSPLNELQSFCWKFSSNGGSFMEKPVTFMPPYWKEDKSSSSAPFNDK